MAKVVLKRGAIEEFKGQVQREMAKALLVVRAKARAKELLVHAGSARKSATGLWTATPRLTG